MDYEEREKDHYHLVIVRDKLDFFNISEFKKIFLEDIITRNNRVAIMLAGNNDEISSSVISMLIIAHKKLTALNGSLVLVKLNEAHRNLIAMAGLANFFNVVDSENDLI
jgi:anti-anti-sigma factor